MYARSQPLGHSQSRLGSLGSTFLIIALTITVLLPLRVVRAQEKIPDEQTNYITGHSAEDRLKLAEKNPLTLPNSTASSLTPPAHDNFANASGFIGSGGSGFTLTTNIDATRETGEPIHGAGAGGVGGYQNSVWYSFTASSTRVITISTSSGGADPIVDTVLSAYTGSSVSTLTPVAENDDYTGMGFYSKITFGVTAGQTYHVAVDGYSY